MHYLARYLYSLRISTGYESVSEYIKTKELPISEAYYRALEGGTKTGKQLMMDTAVALCFALGADQRQFFIHLLKDTLPDVVFEDIIRPIPLESFGNLAEQQNLLRRDLAMYKKEAAKARAAASYVPDDQVVELLRNNQHWLPLVHFIYLVDETNDRELAEVCHKNDISEDVSEILKAFVSAKIIKPIQIDAGTHQVRVQRYLPWFRVPLTASGRQLLDGFTLEETKKTLDQTKGPQPFDSDCSFVESTIDAFSREGRARVGKRIADLLAEITASSETIGPDSESEPYFFSIIVSPRPEYLSNIDIHRKINKLIARPKGKAQATRNKQ